MSGVVHCKFSSWKLATSLFSRNMSRKKWSNEEFPVLEMEIFLVGDQLPQDIFYLLLGLFFLNSLLHSWNVLCTK